MAVQFEQMRELDGHHQACRVYMGGFTDATQSKLAKKRGTREELEQGGQRRFCACEVRLQDLQLRKRARCDVPDFYGRDVQLVQSLCSMEVKARDFESFPMQMEVQTLQRIRDRKNERLYLFVRFNLQAEVKVPDTREIFHGIDQGRQRRRFIRRLRSAF